MCAFLSSTSIIQNVHNSSADFSSAHAGDGFLLRSQRLKRNLLFGDRKFRKVLPDALSLLLSLAGVSWSETSRVPILSLTNMEHWSTLSTFFKRKQHDFPPHTIISVATKLCFLCPLCFLFLSLVCSSLEWAELSCSYFQIFCHFGRPSENSHNMAAGVY